ncbi:MAG: hypothetical protein IKG03_02300 [Clostridiales bacterium]|nr:hypothetical protein [Clostridiales bacterium]
MSSNSKIADRMIAAGDKTGYYAERVYLYGLVFFLASQACLLSASVSQVFYYVLFYAGAALLAVAGIYRAVFTSFSDLRKALPVISVLLIGLAYFLYSVRTEGVTDALVYLLIAFAIAGAVNVKAGHILIAGIIGNLVMIINNVYTNFVRADEPFINTHTSNDFFYFGDDLFYFSKMNNRSTTDWASHYFWIIVAYLWIRGKKITWGEILAGFALDALVYSMTGAATSLVCISLALLITLVYKLYLTFSAHPDSKKASGSENKGSALSALAGKILGFCSRYSFVIIAALMIVLTLSYNIGNPLMYRLNRLLHERLALGQRGIIEHGVHLLASGVPIYGNDSTIDYFYNFLDCSYISVLVRMGILPFVFYIGSMTAVQSKHKKYLYGSLLIAVCALSCIEEHHLTEIPYNFFILILFADLDTEKSEKSFDAVRSSKKDPGLMINIAAVALSIVFAAAAVWVNYPRYTAVKECDRLDEKATEIYYSLQNNLDDLVESGQWQEQTALMSSAQLGEVLSEPYDYPAVTGNTWKEAIKDTKVHSFYSVPYDASGNDGSYDVLEMLISGETKELIGSGSVVIEYDAAAGSIYSVWYSDKSGCRPVLGGRPMHRSERLRLGDDMEGYSTGGVNG